MHQWRQISFLYFRDILYRHPSGLCLDSRHPAYCTERASCKMQKERSRAKAHIEPAQTRFQVKRKTGFTETTGRKQKRISPSTESISLLQQDRDTAQTVDKENRTGNKTGTRGARRGEGTGKYVLSAREEGKEDTQTERQEHITDGEQWQGNDEKEGEKDEKGRDTTDSQHDVPISASVVVSRMPGAIYLRDDGEAYMYRICRGGCPGHGRAAGGVFLSVGREGIAHRPNWQRERQERKKSVLHTNTGAVESSAAALSAVAACSVQRAAATTMYYYPVNTLKIQQNTSAAKIPLNKQVSDNVQAKATSQLTNRAQKRR